MLDAAWTEQHSVHLTCSLPHTRARGWLSPCYCHQTRTSRLHSRCSGCLILYAQASEHAGWPCQGKLVPQTDQRFKDICGTQLLS